MFSRFKNYIFVITILFSFFIFSIFISFAQNGEVINRVETNEKQVALTFDADMTPKMLREMQEGKVKNWYNQEVIDELKKENVPATLFLTGMWIEQYATVTQELANNNLFEIGNHSYSHPGFSPHCFKLKTVVDDARDELEISQTTKLLDKYAPNHKMYFRFPGLCYEPKDLDILKKQNYEAIGADVRGGDGFQNNSKIIADNVIHKVKPGSIVVMHMMGGPNAPETSIALPIIIDKLRNEGYKFVKISDLLNENSTSTTTSPGLKKVIYDFVLKYI